MCGWVVNRDACRGAALCRFWRGNICLLLSETIQVLTFWWRVRELGPNSQPHAKQAALKWRAGCKGRGVSDLVDSSSRQACTDSTPATAADQGGRVRGCTSTT